MCSYNVLYKTVSPRIPANMGIFRRANPEDIFGGMTFSLGLDADGLVAAVETGLGENFIQTSVESVIDGVYDWLEEDAAEPQFSIDLTGRQATVATALGSELTQQLGALEKIARDPNALSSTMEATMSPQRSRFPMRLAPQWLAQLLGAIGLISRHGKEGR